MMDFLRRSLEPPWADDEIRVVSIPVPVGEAERLMGGVGDGPAFFWDAGDGRTYAGVGAAELIEGSGVERGKAVADQADRLWSRLRSVVPPDFAPAPARLFGGMAFGTGPLPPSWGGFGEATFVLPRYAYERREGSARLSIAVSPSWYRQAGTDGVVNGACAVLERLGAGPGEPDPRPAPDGAGPAATEDDPSRAEAWARAVDSIQRRIASGRADKIVAARAHRLTFETAPDPVGVLRRLRPTTAAARFSFRFGTATFLGAAPERLIGRQGPRIRSEAVAGSMPADRAERTDDLLTSAKDTVEHAFVVRAIADVLGPLCERLEYPEQPHIRQVGPVLHLRTPFVGLLSRPVPALELALRLHPTPAVGGTPTDEALDWITHEERTGRGWYAAPVGWFDGAGDGDFVVALRCALLDGRTATLFAGAGIVDGSDAGAEFAETELKLRTMLDALGRSR